jgi:hypothetical protein
MHKLLTTFHDHMLLAPGTKQTLSAEQVLGAHHSAVVRHSDAVEVQTARRY